MMKYTIRKAYENAYIVESFVETNFGGSAVNFVSEANSLSEAKSIIETLEKYNAN